ncbi:MAG: VOC family protein [Gelidibacter sp.]
MKIPSEHQAVMPYLILKKASKFIDFSQNVFGATIIHKTFRNEAQAILAHCELQIDGSTIMFADATQNFEPQTANLFVYVDDADKRFQLAIDNGASILMELSNQEYGRTCGVTDPFGNVWWITSLPE